MENVRKMNTVVIWACIGLCLCRLQCETKSRLGGRHELQEFSRNASMVEAVLPELALELLVFSQAGGV